ncbi:hypothetical protein GCM10023196_053870 [Actinoallomurus vinaceus]|uniref:Uncharacterized protein n=1 Tax=Actinoallomurus vinaceus TaxID=1080074 RepID=A0ABP8UHM0_9ACTN
MAQLSENYQRGLAERKAWLKANPGKTWADAIEAYKARRLAETTTPRTHITETTPQPAQPSPPTEPAVPLHKMDPAEFANHSAQHWAGVFDDLNNRRPDRAPFFDGWDSPLTRGDTR